MSYRPEFLIEGKWYANGERYATYDEAYKSARARFMNWYVPTDCRAVESPDPVNYRWDIEQGGVMLTSESQE